MTYHLNALALELRSIFTDLFAQTPPPRKLRFEKPRGARKEVVGISFVQPAKWPDATYDEMNKALLALHHAGFIVYGANTVTLNGKLINRPSENP